MMKKIMFTYDMAGMGQRERMAIRRRLFGYLDKSNMGRYRYKREGLLSKMEYECPVRCCLLLNQRDGARLERFFRENRVKYTRFTVTRHDRSV